MDELKLICCIHLLISKKFVSKENMAIDRIHARYLKKIRFVRLNMLPDNCELLATDLTVAPYQVVSR